MLAAATISLFLTSRLQRMTVTNATTQTPTSGHRRRNTLQGLSKGSLSTHSHIERIKSSTNRLQKYDIWSQVLNILHPGRHFTCEWNQILDKQYNGFFPRAEALRQLLFSYYCAISGSPVCTALHFQQPFSYCCTCASCSSYTIYEDLKCLYLGICCIC